MAKFRQLSPGFRPKAGIFGALLKETLP